jgi:hypothetical protein
MAIEEFWNKSPKQIPLGVVFCRKEKYWLRSIAAGICILTSFFRGCLLQVQKNSNDGLHRFGKWTSKMLGVIRSLLRWLRGVMLGSRGIRGTINDVGSRPSCSMFSFIGKRFLILSCGLGRVGFRLSGTSPCSPRSFIPFPICVILSLAFVYRSPCNFNLLRRIGSWRACSSICR